MNKQATLELPKELVERLNAMAAAEQVPVATLLERMAAAEEHHPTPALIGGNGGALLGEAVPHEEIHVWDRPHDDSYSMYVGDYAD